MTHPPSVLSGAADDTFQWPGFSGPLTVRLYAPARKSEALFVCFAPGGFVVADLDAANDCLRSFAETNQLAVLAPSYAVAPDQPFPAAIEDSHAVLKQAAALGSRLRGWTGRHLLVGGIEAGGNLAAVSALMCRDRLGPKLAGQLLIMPMLDPSMRGAGPSAATAVGQALNDSYRDYLPRAADRVHPYACPLESSRLASLPPALIIYADDDPLAAGALAYADKLERAGVPVQRAVLPATAVADVDDRCDAAEDRECAQAVQTFLAPFLRPVRRAPPKSVASVLLPKDPEASHD